VLSKNFFKLEGNQKKLIIGSYQTACEIIMMII